MAKRVFFSFHYQDVIDLRANVVRNHWVLKNDRKSSGFFDASVWESAKKDSPIAVKRLINRAISNTSNTCILIGSDTYERRWVRYEIIKSLASGNHLFGVHINKIRGRNQLTENYGLNPFDYLGYEYSDDGTKLNPIELKNGKWVYFKDYESYKLKSKPAKEKWGKSFKLSKDYDTHCWNKDSGYNNFASWTK
ncbi:TIR domain-containing protein [Maribacter aquivivus]|uniref:TIR domain-containing protein n=1 Tax=Maribacter aquivivus TaxID=228958 RepID=UPI00249285B7|nr:TIR domain-containing protein [Maribacter aquivivus]